MSNEKKVLMKIEHLTKEFEIKSKKLGGKPQILHALNDVSVDIYEGETLGVIGESGCGKSTFGRTLIQLHKATAGSVTFGGKDLFSLKGAELKKAKKDVQMVFQDPYSSLDPRKTAGKLIEEPLIVHKLISDKNEREKRVLELMREVGLDIQHVHRFPHEFSGGQRQRVAMGRAIVRNPKVFLMDEPLSNLDAKLRVQMRIEIQKIHQRLETTIIYVTHDQTEAMTLGTRIVVLKDGIIQQVDTPQNLYDKPCNVFVAGFMGSPQMNLINAKVVQSGEDVVLMFGGNTVKLPEGKAQKLIEAGYVDTTVIMGIRPEDLNDSEVIINANPDCVIEATIRVYELLGAEVYLYFDIDEVNCTARVNPRTTARPGDTIKLGIDMTKLHIFDKDTEQVILH